MRLGELPGGQLLCNTGDRVRFVRGEQPTSSAARGRNAGVQRHAVPTTATTPEMTTTYEPLIDELQPGDRIMLADGIVSLIVEKVSKDSAECRVVQSGLIRSRQGVNLPGVKLSVAALNDIDRENAVWAAKQDIDFVGLSFVRRAEDVGELKACSCLDERSGLRRSAGHRQDRVKLFLPSNRLGSFRCSDLCECARNIESKQARQTLGGIPDSSINKPQKIANVDRRCQTKRSRRAAGRTAREGQRPGKAVSVQICS